MSLRHLCSNSPASSDAVQPICRRLLLAPSSGRNICSHAHFVTVVSSSSYGGDSSVLWSVYVISSLSRQVSAGVEAASRELRARVTAAPTVSCYEHGHLLAIVLICGFRAHGNDTVRWAHTPAETVMTQCLQITHLLSLSPLPRVIFRIPLHCSLFGLGGRRPPSMWRTPSLAEPQN